MARIDLEEERAEGRRVRTEPETRKSERSEMKDTTVVLTMIFALRLLVPGERINEQCQVHNKTQITCSCVGDEVRPSLFSFRRFTTITVERQDRLALSHDPTVLYQRYNHNLFQEFLLPDGYNYENISSFFLSSCSSAVVHFSSLTEAKHIRDIVVRNISDSLTFQPFVTSRNIRRLELVNTGRIPVITHNTFTSVECIELLRIENTKIENFEEEFMDTNVTDLILGNVTIERMEGFNFSERGRTLRITNCSFRNVETTLNFAYFSAIEILNSKFELRKPGQMSIEGDRALVKNSVFLNVSVNLVAFGKITINDTCADGKSSLRLSSGNIESFGNRLPTEIIYTKSRETHSTELLLLIHNNTVCIAGNCKCPKSDARSSYQTFFPTFHLGTLLSIFSSKLVLEWTHPLLHSHSII